MAKAANSKDKNQTVKAHFTRKRTIIVEGPEEIFSVSLEQLVFFLKVKN